MSKYWNIKKRWSTYVLENFWAKFKKILWDFCSNRNNFVSECDEVLVNCEGFKKFLGIFWGNFDERKK